MATSETIQTGFTPTRPLKLVCLVLVLTGMVSFLTMLFGSHPERAWQAYLINFLLFSAIAQGGLLFSVVMRITNAQWSGPLKGLAESFSAFFPVSLILFLLLFLGSDYVFPWLHHDLHGKEQWLNLPFLFSRDFVALLILYGLGAVYLYYSLRLRGDQLLPQGRIRSMLLGCWSRRQRDAKWCRARMTFWGVLYALAYGLVLTLIAFDFIMSMEPHWISTLFGPYYFISAFYMGLGGLIILAAILQVIQGEDSTILPRQMQDVGKLLFAFCLLWGDFFYCQLVVIWYGNIAEETSYIIERTMVMPWRSLSWTVFILCFLIPFTVLLNRRVKTRPLFMTALCGLVLVGMWLEHLLLVGPVLNRGAVSLPLGVGDGLISIGFLGLMAAAVTSFLALFPPVVPIESREERE